MEDKVHINSYYIYGTSLSMEGVIDNIDTSYDDLDFVLYIICNIQIDKNLCVQVFKFFIVYRQRSCLYVKFYSVVFR